MVFFSRLLGKPISSTYITAHPQADAQQQECIWFSLYHPSNQTFIPKQASSSLAGREDPPTFNNRQKKFVPTHSRTITESTPRQGHLPTLSLRRKCLVFPDGKEGSYKISLYFLHPETPERCLYSYQLHVHTNTLANG